MNHDTANRLDDLLHRWSTWVENGWAMPTRQQVTHFLKVRTTKVNQNTGPDVDCVEFRIEQAVSALAKQSQQQAAVVRCEYSIKHQRLRQLDRSLLLNMSLRTYQRHLSHAKTFISGKLDEY